MRHDIWDADVANPPILLDIGKGQDHPRSRSHEQERPGVLLDRVNGKPIYGVGIDRAPERSAAGADREDAAVSAEAPAAFADDDDEADIATVTPELEAACRKLMEGMQLGGPYLPVGFNRLRLQFPGNHGGVNWGGASFNPGSDTCSSTRVSRPGARICGSPAIRAVPHQRRPRRPRRRSRLRSRHLPPGAAAALVVAAVAAGVAPRSASRAADVSRTWNRT